MKYRKKPVVIDAMQFTEKSKDQCFDFFTCTAVLAFDAVGNSFLRIQTLEGVIAARLGDWIIKGVSGEFYPCKPDIFDKTYEAVT